MPFSLVSISKACRALLLLGVGVEVVHAAAPNVALFDKMEEAEHLMVDTNNFNAVGFSGIVQGCGQIFNDDEQPSAQWLRLAFHDVIEHQHFASPPTGGLDASIAFELSDSFNNAPFVIDTLHFFKPFVSAYLSMADLIALGVKMAVSACGTNQNNLELSVGRVDAQVGGQLVVPSPSLNLSSTLERFKTAGFSPPETIQLTACGHTLGRVHAKQFPAVLPNQGNAAFDETPQSFDHAVVADYVNWQPPFGGPLVTSVNVDERSDLRLYQSDNNVTINAMNSITAFQAQCDVVLTKMLNMVPGESGLSPPVNPKPWKLVDLRYNLADDGRLFLSGFVRGLVPSGGAFPQTVGLQYAHVIGAVGAMTLSQSGNRGSGIFGDTNYYTFSILVPGVTLTQPAAIAQISFQDVSYGITPAIFVDTTRSIITFDAVSNTTTIAVVAAALTSMGSDIWAHVYVPEPMPNAGDLTNMVANNRMPTSTTSVLGQYTLYTAQSLQDLGDIRGKIIVVQMEQNGGVWSESVKTSLFTDKTAQ